MKYLFLLFSFTMFGQECPDILHNTNNPNNFTEVLVYDGTAIVDTVHCPTAGNSNNINCEDLLEGGFTYVIGDCVYDDTGTPIGHLYVDLDKYDLYMLDGVVVAEWSTFAEKNNDYFTIEYSEDGYYWREVHFEPEAGNSQSKKEYSVKLYEGGGYYRLSQTDYDGTHEILGVKFVLPVEEKEVIGIYSLSGEKVNKNVYRGIAIIRYEDGSVIKKWLK